MSDEELLPSTTPARLSVDLLRRKLHQQAHLVALARYLAFFALFVLCVLDHIGPTTSHATWYVVQQAEALVDDDEPFEEINTVAAVNQWTRQTLPAILASVHELCPGCRVALLAAGQLEWVGGQLSTTSDALNVCGDDSGGGGGDGGGNGGGGGGGGGGGSDGGRAAYALDSCANAGVVQMWLANHLAQQHAHAPARPARAARAREPGVAASVLVEREGHQLVLKFRTAERVGGSTLVECSMDAFSRPATDGVGLAGGGVLSPLLNAMLVLMLVRMLADELAEARAAWVAGSGAFGAYLADGWNWLDCGLLALPPLVSMLADTGHEEAAHWLSGVTICAFSVRFFRSASCLAPYRLFLATIDAAAPHLANLAICAITSMVLLALAGHVTFGLVSESFATLPGSLHVTLCIILDGFYDLPPELEQRTPRAAAAFKYVGVALLALLLLNMLIVVLMEAFDAVRAAQAADKLVDNTASGELLHALPGWRPLRPGALSAWYRFRTATPWDLARDLLLEPHTCGMRTAQLWEAMQAAEANDDDEYPPVESSLGGADGGGGVSDPGGDGDGDAAPTYLMLNVEELAQALDNVQPGLRVHAKPVMERFGMVPEVSRHRAARRGVLNVVRLRSAVVSFGSTKQLPAQMLRQREKAARSM